MDTWSDRVESLLYDGETVENRVEVGDSVVVVTGHRVLAFTPTLEGKNFREVQRPNVTGAAVSTAADSGFLTLGVRAGVYGMLLLAIGFVVDFGAILGGVDLTSEGTQQLGIGNVMGMVQGLLSLIAELDYYMRLLGGLLVAFAVVPIGVYLWSRERHLVLEVAGGDDIRVATPADAEGALRRLREAVLPDDVVVEEGTGLGLESINPFR